MGMPGVPKSTHPAGGTHRQLRAGGRKPRCCSGWGPATISLLKKQWLGTSALPRADIPEAGLDFSSPPPGQCLELPARPTATGTAPGYPQGYPGALVPCSLGCGTAVRGTHPCTVLVVTKHPQGWRSQGGAAWPPRFGTHRAARMAQREAPHSAARCWLKKK